MTAVLDVVDCPQCGWRAFYEFQTRTFTTTIICPRCGYPEETRPMSSRRTKAGELVYRTTKHPGYGAYMLKRRNGVSEIGALDRALTRDMIARFKQHLKQPAVDAKGSFLTRWNAKRRRVEVVIGRMPNDLP